MSKLIRITTVPLSLKVLLKGQMRYMRQRGFEVLMVSAEGPEIEEIIEYEECPHYIIPMTRAITPVADMIALWKMILLMKREKPDIVHTHTPKAGILGMLAAKWTGVPVRIHTVAGLPLQVSSGMKRRLLEAVEKMTYRNATEVWPNSESLYQYIAKHQFYNSGKMKVIGFGSSNGIDPGEFSPELIRPERLAAVKEKTGYDPGLKYLVFIGRVVADKGVNELVRVFLRLSKDHPDLRLVLIGPFESELDPLDPKIEREIKEHPFIHAVGHSNEIPEYLFLADLLVFPSHREGFPNVPMQAALMYCPVICSGIGGNTDIVDHHENGLIFEVRNEEDMQDKIQYALDHPELMKDMAAKLRDKILKHFSREYVQAEILKNYRRLIKGIGSRE